MKKPLNFTYPSENSLNNDQNDIKNNDNNNNNYKNYKNQGKFNSSNVEDVDKLLEIVMQGLGMTQLPDISKMNISQMEYETKYNEYLSRIRDRIRREKKFNNDNMEYLNNFNLPTIFTSYKHNASDTHQYRKKRSINLSTDQLTDDNDDDHITASSPLLQSHNIIYIRFPLKTDKDQQDYDDGDIEEANLRLMLVTDSDLIHHSIKKQNLFTNHHSHNHHHHNHQNEYNKHVINLKVYQLIEPYGKIWLDTKKIEINIMKKQSQWLEFDVTKAVEGWLSGRQENLGLEIHCDNCHLYGTHIIDDSLPTTKGTFLNDDDSATSDFLMTTMRTPTTSTSEDLSPVLNIIGRIGGIRREKRSRQHHHLMPAARKKRKTDCYEGNQKCCRHSMEVIFREIKGFEFIIQPKIFDAGYCRGKCPPRYNPAHHHAVLQSLIWKQDRSKAPRPCCAPSKLVELEILHVDEKDSRKLKVSTWNDMRVVECACS